MDLSMKLRKLVDIIRMNGIQDIKRKLSSYFRNKYTHFLYKYIAKNPFSEVWQGQWYEYNKIVKKYIDATYDIETLFPKNTNAYDEKNIWVYWNSGIETAPEIVKKCYIQLQKNIPSGYRLINLSQKNIDDFVLFPDFITEKIATGRISQTHFSDILRTAVIYRYGGIWFDATCLLTDDIPKRVLNSKFFVFQANRLNQNETRPPIKCSSWFISSNLPKCRIPERTLQILLAYWQNNKRLCHYYLYHIIIAALIDHDEQCAEIWNEMPYICNMNPHVLMFSFGNAYTEDLWQNAIGSCFVHKLTYKYNSKLMEATKENILQHLMRLF